MGKNYKKTCEECMLMKDENITKQVGAKFLHKGGSTDPTFFDGWTDNYSYGGKATSVDVTTVNRSTTSKTYSMVLQFWNYDKWVDTPVRGAGTMLGSNTFTLQLVLGDLHGSGLPIGGMQTYRVKCSIQGGYTIYTESFNITR